MKKIRLPPWEKSAGDREDRRISGRYPACWCPAQGLNYPGCSAFSLWFPLGFHSREGELKAGCTVRKIRE